MSIDSEFRGPIKARKLSEGRNVQRNDDSDTSMTTCESLLQLYLKFDKPGCRLVMVRCAFFIRLMVF